LDFPKIDVILDHLWVPTSFAAGTPENVGLGRVGNFWLTCYLLYLFFLLSRRVKKIFNKSVGDIPIFGFLTHFG
jgi:hypothetical protein